MAAKLRGKARKAMEALTEAARVAEVMVDGEEAKRIVVDRAMHHIANPNPEHRFMAGDYFDVDHGPFLRTKKTLARLARLLEFPCGTKLWVRVKGLDDHVTLAVQNGGLNRYWTFGQLKLKAEGEVAECLGSGRVTAAPAGETDELLTVLAPVRDSLGDVVGLVELTAKNPASRSLDPAWS